MRKLIMIALLLAFVAVPVAQAATYHYVDIYGQVRNLQASNAQEALVVASALPTTLHTGVKLDTGLLDRGDIAGQLYAYMDVAGNYRIITASSVDAAWLVATDRHPNSGLVMLEADLI